MPEPTQRARRLDVLQAEIPHLRRYASVLSGDRDQAEDLVQDCLLRAISRFDRFAPGTNLRAWLFTILRNGHIDTVRRRQRRGREVPIEPARPEFRQPPNQFARCELRRTLAAIDHLRPCDRTTLQLVVMRGMKYDEVADRMGVAVGTVKSRLSRARQELREAA